MSAFVVHSEEGKIFVAADTLLSKASSENGNSPIGFTSKIHPIINKRMLMIGLGMLECTMKWYNIVNQRILAKDILGVNEYSTRGMREFLFPLLNKNTGADAVIYQLGFDSNNQIHFFEYESRCNFVSKEMLVRDFVRPGFGNPMEGVQDIDGILDRMFLILQNVKKHSEQISPNHIGTIGGEMQLSILTPNEYTTRIYKSFPDYEQMYKTVLNKCSDIKEINEPLVGGEEE